MHTDFNFNERLNGLVGIRDIGAIGKSSSYKIYEIIRMDNGVLKGVWASEGESGPYVSKGPSFPLLKEGKFLAQDSCLSEKRLKEILMSDGCTADKADSIIDTANFFRNAQRRSPADTEKSCASCMHESIAAIAKEWNDSASCAAGAGLKREGFGKVIPATGAR